MSPVYAATALEVIVQEWKNLGLDPEEKYVDLGDDELLDSLVERMTSLLLVRIVAILADKRAFEDLSISTICRTVLMQDKPWSAYAPGITDEFISQLNKFVRIILSGYNDTPYHCNEHAFHVCLSTSKLIDMLLSTDSTRTKTYGLRHDPLAQFSLVFAALIHDVEHKGVPNRQLVIENDPLAILYNDESVAEQRSLFIGFDQFLKPEFTLLRDTIFQGFSTTSGSETYRLFRKMVIDLVLNTDIASPARTQIAKSKFKEAFGDPFETMERKLKQIQGAETEEDGSVSESATPESSEAAEDDEALSVGLASTGSSIMSYGYDINISNDRDGCIMNGKPGQAPTRVVKRNCSGISGISHASRHLSMPMGRRSSIQLLREDEAEAAKFQRRMSSIAAPGSMNGRRRSSASFRKRLGIRRSMDLCGEALEAYQQSKVLNADLDEPDELKKTVVMEAIMTAADVAHNLQGWEQMVIWSSRLYMELRRAHLEGRGGDPKVRWFENQIGFLESYLLPLAHKLEDTGVFGENMGRVFADIVEANRDRWLMDGNEITEAVVSEGAELYKQKTVAEETELALKFRATNIGT